MAAPQRPLGNDGRTDLVLIHGKVSVLLQNSDGTLGAPTSYSVSGVGFGGVAIGDSNGDGRSDTVVSYGGNKPNSFIGRFLQNAGGTFNPVVSYPPKVAFWLRSLDWNSGSVSNDSRSLLTPA